MQQSLHLRCLTSEAAASCSIASGVDGWWWPLRIQRTPQSSLWSLELAKVAVQEVMWKSALWRVWRSDCSVVVPASVSANSMKRVPLRAEGM